MGQIAGFTETVMVLANMAIAALGAAMNGESKITASHLGRQAVVYVRQSSLAQVRDHTESSTSWCCGWPPRIRRGGIAGCTVSWSAWAIR